MAHSEVICSSLVADCQHWCISTSGILFPNTKMTVVTQDLFHDANEEQQSLKNLERQALAGL